MGCLLPGRCRVPKHTACPVSLCSPCYRRRVCLGAPDAADALREICGVRAGISALTALLTAQGKHHALQDVLLWRLDAPLRRAGGDAETGCASGSGPLAGRSLQLPPSGHWQWAIKQSAMSAEQVGAASAHSVAYELPALHSLQQKAAKLLLQVTMPACNLHSGAVPE